MFGRSLNSSGLVDNYSCFRTVLRILAYHRSDKTKFWVVCGFLFIVFLSLTSRNGWKNHLLVSSDNEKILIEVFAVRVWHEFIQCIFFIFYYQLDICSVEIMWIIFLIKLWAINFPSNFQVFFNFNFKCISNRFLC